MISIKTAAYFTQWLQDRHKINHRINVQVEREWVLENQDVSNKEVKVKWV